MSEKTQNVETEFMSFLLDAKTLQMATLAQDGSPWASYSPCVFLPGRGFIVQLSELAAHTQNLLKNPKMSFMVIADEGESPNLHARLRAAFLGEAERLSRGDEAYQEGIKALKRNHDAELVANLESLGDFHLFFLKPQRGQFVKGFGQAFEVGGDWTLTHRKMRS